jgi:hypothetical protein
MTSQHMGWSNKTEGAGMCLGMQYVQLMPKSLYRISQAFLAPSQA